MLAFLLLQLVLEQLVINLLGPVLRVLHLLHKKNQAQNTNFLFESQVMGQHQKTDV